MAQQDQLGKAATTIRQDGIWTEIVYHDTVVVKFNRETIILNSGGWKTATTKTRINQAANQFGLGFSLAQVKGNWIVTQRDTGNQYAFNDGLVIFR